MSETPAPASSPDSQGRYVVLWHETPADYPRPPHFDLMLQAGDALATWAVERWPGPGETVAAERLADHRRAYLTYEGPVSGDRGTVRRVASGAYTLRRTSAGVELLLHHPLLGKDESVRIEASSDGSLVMTNAVG